MLPIIFIRYALLSIVNKEALERARFFPPMKGNERIAFWGYQISLILMFFLLIFLNIKLDTVLSCVGLVIYLLGMILYTISIIHFAKPQGKGINLKGLYKVSRNPMYVSFFLYFLGLSILASSWLLLILLIMFQVSSHFIILSEERWCLKEFGKEYKSYMRKVRRYM